MKYIDKKIFTAIVVSSFLFLSACSGTSEVLVGAAIESNKPIQETEISNTPEEPKTPEIMEFPDIASEPTPILDPTTTPYPEAKGMLALVSRLEGNDDIYIMNVDGSGKLRLTYDNGDDQQPDVSPDQTQIVFSSNREGNCDIYKINIDGSGLQRLTVDPGKDATPKWSPDGNFIVFTSFRDQN